MERAALDLLSAIGEGPALLVIAGPLEGIPRSTVSHALGKRPGWVGRMAAVPSIRRQVQEAKWTVVVAVGIWSYIPTSIALVGLRHRVILWEHSLLPWRLRHDRPLALAAVALRILSFKCQLAICVSQATCSTTRPLVWPFARAIVIPNLLSTSNTPVQHGPSGRLSSQLLGLGSLTRRKNWELAIRAMSFLPDAYTLSIAGDGPDRDRLVRLIRSLGLEKRVSLLGYVENGSTLLPNAAAMVHPSWAETFGFALVEAAEHGVPVVSLKMPVMSEVIPEYVPGALTTSNARSFAQGVIAVASIGPEEFAAASLARSRVFDQANGVAEWQATLSAQATRPSH